MAPPRGGAEAARARAARAYADKRLPQLAAELGWSKETLARVERGARALDSDERAALAAACGLPAEFFTADFALLTAIAPAAPVARAVEPLLRDVLERLERLERRVQAAA
jgi:transcriptional regulator with XRE-family HTH domain